VTLLAIFFSPECESMFLFQKRTDKKPHDY
jgi:hypothetical protein